MQNKAAAGATKQVTGAEQTWAVPNTLAQLMEVLKSPSKVTGGTQPRIIAGNTGSGETFAFQNAAMQALHGTSPSPIMHVYLSKVTFKRIAVTALACLLPATQHTNGTALRDVTKCTP